MKLPGWEIIDEGVTPEAAIAWWKQRAKLTDAEARALTEGARQRAFYVTGLARRDLVQLVSDGIQAALENGETLDSFRETHHGCHTRGRLARPARRTHIPNQYAVGIRRRTLEKDSGGQGVPPLSAICGAHGPYPAKPCHSAPALSIPWITSSGKRTTRPTASVVIVMW